MAFIFIVYILFCMYNFDYYRNSKINWNLWTNFFLFENIEDACHAIIQSLIKSRSHLQMKEKHESGTVTYIWHYYDFVETFFLSAKDFCSRLKSV